MGPKGPPSGGFCVFRLQNKLQLYSKGVEMTNNRKKKNDNEDRLFTIFEMATVIAMVAIIILIAIVAYLGIGA